MIHASTTFPRHRPDFWSAVDGDDDSGELMETKKEAAEYHDSLVQELQWKEIGNGQISSFAPVLEIRAETAKSTHTGLHIDMPSPEQTIQAPSWQVAATPPIQDPPTPSAANQTAPPPSFHPSHFLQTSTPRGLTSTFPSVPTPSEKGTPHLPRPASTVISRHNTRGSKALDTPDHIASPVDSPSTDTSRPLIDPNLHGDGHGRRDDPATPVPIGKSALSEIKSKREHQAISKHFDLLTKVLVKDQIAPPTKGKGKPISGKTLGMAASLGGKVFDRLRFCLTSEVNQTSKLKQRADIITNLGGQVVLQPDTAITHVIYDAGRSASLLAQKLGLETISELPAGTVCVKWDWVVQCKMAGKMLDTTPWLSFPKTSFSRDVSTNAMKPTSRIFDITDQKREATASDSDTEESARKRTRLGQTKSFTLFAPISEKSESNQQAGPSRIRSLANLGVSVATEHQLPSGPGWERASRNDRDALDDMIDGVMKGSIVDQEVSITPRPQAGASLTNVKGKSDGFKCAQKMDGKGYTGPNEWLAKKFEELYDLYQGQVGKNSFAIRGYQRACFVQIDEFLSGAQGRAFYENTEQARCVALFKDIYGVGRQHANDLYRLGARSIDDLRTGRYSLTAGQMIGLQLYDDLKARIPRNECKDIFEIIRSEAQAIDDKVWIEIMGSYRRGQDSSGDVDILITREGEEGDSKKGIVKELIQRLKKKGLVTHDLGTPTDWSAPEAKWMGVGRLSTVHKHRRIDILSIPFENWGAALIYFTGNEVFNRSMRLYARKQGFGLNQRGLYKGVMREKDGTKLTEGELVASRTEQDIFDALGLRWRSV
uniref:DNA polymerase lambda n=1 Tax=Kwoniella pini CBS 10737 TaxID=1296096 RepID=A0A1B9I171_9TREE|nr:uncharacterized protein I206_04943 [Kwoniella pini CBS 10737]OCF49255.1 hypothetical protein I206_04943 [Kwoniella pini CBS 10737]